VRRRRSGAVEVDTQTRSGKSRPGRMAPRSRRGGQTGLLRVGLKTRLWDDFYHRALTLSWPRFLLVVVAVYLATNVVFAALYMLQPGAVVNARPGMFRDAFFFSVETFGTIGYGVLSPATDYANAVMTVETLTGIMLVALTTGIMFARVSRPTARVIFSKVAVISDYDGVPTLMVRMGNQRASQIVQAEVGISLLRDEVTREGASMRRFYDLKLARSRTPVFAMSFLAMHPLDTDSPLFGATSADLEAMEAELLVTVTGLDETMGQTVHARVSYLPEEVLFGQRYRNIFGLTPDGTRAIDYRQFHQTESVGDHVRS
jgi:inward rectifier potassium channel